MNRIVMMGPPGAGKGTQSAHLSLTLGVPAISTGDLFRDHIRSSSEIGLRVSALIDAGEYVPDEITNAMVAQRIAELGAREGFILDGYPRTLTQVDQLDRMLAKSENVVDLVIVIDVPAEAVSTRLLLRAGQQARSDDAPDTIRRRLEVFEKETRPLLELYTDRGLLVTVDGRGSLTEVAGRIEAAVSAGASRANEVHMELPVAALSSWE